MTILFLISGGRVGIVYNTKLVKKTPQHWNDLWSPEYRNQIMMVDGAREVIGFSLNSLGYSFEYQEHDGIASG